MADKSGTSYQFGSDQQAVTTWWQSLQMLVYHLAGALVLAALACWWQCWPWYYAVVIAIAAGLLSFSWYGRQFVLEQRDWPWAVLESKTPRPPAPEPARPLVINHGPRPQAAGLPAVTPAQQLERVSEEERANWEDLRYFVQRIDHGEPATSTHWVTTPRRILPSGREMTRPRYEAFRDALLAVRAAVRIGTYQTATVELVVGWPEAMARLKQAQETDQGALQPLQSLLQRALGLQSGRGEAGERG